MKKIGMFALGSRDRIHISRMRPTGGDAFDSSHRRAYRCSD